MFSKLLTVTALVAVFVSTASAYPLDCDRPLFRVLDDDTCDTICDNGRVSNYQLGLINPEFGADCRGIRNAQLLCLGRKGQDCTDLHKVTYGETCEKISASTGVGVDILKQNNPNLGKDCQFINPGEVLCIAKEAIPYTPNED